MTSSTRKERLGFASYDFSNSGYVAVFQSFLFPLVLASNTDDLEHSTTVLWAVIVSVSSLLAIILAPFVGRFADRVGKVRVFGWTVVLTALLAAISGPLFSTYVIALAISFIAFNLFFELSQSLYDSFLSNLGRNSIELNSISTFAWGFGYLGGALFALIYLVMSKLGVSEVWMLSIFAVLFLILSLPSIRVFSKIDNVQPPKPQSLGMGEILKVRSPVPWLDLFVYWIIADTVAAIMYFAPIYMSDEVGLSITEIGGLMLGGQLLAFPVTVMVGRVANRIGQLNVLRIGILIWALSIFGLALAQSLTHVILVLVGFSFVIGSTQAILRAHYVSRVSVSKSGEALGFFAIAQKSASVVSPAMIALVVYLTGSLRLAFVLLGVLLTIAFFAVGVLPDNRDHSNAED